MTNASSTESWRDWLTTVEPKSRRQARLGRAYVTWRRFSENRLAVTGLAIILALVAIAALAPLLMPHSATIGDLAGNRLKPPGTPGFLLGTDDQAATSCRA